MTQQPESLAHALKRHYGDASHSLYCQARLALKGVLLAYVGPEADLDTTVGYTSADDIGERDIQQATSAWYHEGLSPATINKRLNCLSKMGLDVGGLRVKNPKQLKWHLKESDKPKVLEWLRQKPSSDFTYKIAADFIEWTTLTGLRIEESLRLELKDFATDGSVLGDFWTFTGVSVPGTKTSSSQATLPLGKRAALIAKDRLRCGVNPLMFPIVYDELLAVWSEVRGAFGWKDDPTATLKALRRSTARYLHVDCGMPLHMVQQYLRHESMDTTLEYLRLTGGYGTEEMRRYLK